MSKASCHNPGGSLFRPPVVTSCFRVGFSSTYCSGFPGAKSMFSKKYVVNPQTCQSLSEHSPLHPPRPKTMLKHSFPGWCSAWPVLDHCPLRFWGEGAAIPTGLGSHILCVTRDYVTDTYGHYCWFTVSGWCDHVGSVSCAGDHIAATSATNSVVVTQHGGR